MAGSFKRYIHFSKKETIAVIVLACILVPLVLLPVIGKNIFKNKEEPAKSESTEWITETGERNNDVVDNTNAGAYGEYRNYDRRSSQYSNRRAAITGRLFNFDPNTASPEQLKELGLRDRTISILANYRNKGGRFRKAEDLQKIYGLRTDEFERLRPFIVIAGTGATEKSFSDNINTNQYNVQAKHEWKRKVAVIDINTADTAAFQSLYGIGSKLAARIVNFRDKLGGFYRVEQVGETYGVPDSTFQKIKPYLRLEPGSTQKLNLNTATYDELNAHPYISSKLAYLIMKYRKENGSFSNLDDIKEIIGETNDSYEKVMNYLTI